MALYVITDVVCKGINQYRLDASYLTKEEILSEYKMLGTSFKIILYYKSNNPKQDLEKIFDHFKYNRSNKFTNWLEIDIDILKQYMDLYFSAKDNAEQTNKLKPITEFSLFKKLHVYGYSHFPLFVPSEIKAALQIRPDIFKKIMNSFEENYHYVICNISKKDKPSSQNGKLLTYLGLYHMLHLSNIDEVDEIISALKFWIGY